MLTTHPSPWQTADINSSEVEVLYLRNVSAEDAGEYTCLAGNSIGLSYQSAWLTVLPGQCGCPGVGAGTPSTQRPWLRPTHSLSPEEELVRETEAPETKYTDIIIYTSGSLAVAMAVIIVVLCRMQTQSSKQPLEPMAVHKLSKFPLIRQVGVDLEPWVHSGTLVTDWLCTCHLCPSHLTLLPALGAAVSAAFCSSPALLLQARGLWPQSVGQGG